MSLATALSYPTTFERRRARELYEGPSAEHVADVLERLKADDSEVTDAYACLDHADYLALDALIVEAYRSADWAKFGTTLAGMLDASLKRRATAEARDEIEAKWRDASEAVAGVC